MKYYIATKMTQLATVAMGQYSQTWQEESQVTGLCGIKPLIENSLCVFT